MVRPINFIHGKTGCPKCAGRGVDWIERFRTVHGDTYNYSQVVYTDYKKPVQIICSTHGVFFQTPDNHYRNRQGCPKCKGKRIQQSKQLPFSDFVLRATAVHGDKFSYVCRNWENLLTSKIEITCEHGTHRQTAVNHLAGKIACQKCGNMKSAPEQAIADFLKIFTPVVQRDRTVIAPKELDIVLPNKHLAVEFCGLYWHSHFDAETENKNKFNHYNKYMSCKAQNIRLVTVFENEWEERQPQIKRLLRNAIGKTKGKLMARKCAIQSVNHTEAKAFYDKYHPQGGEGSGEHYGLYWKGKLVACMRFSFGANDRGHSERTWTLARYATRINVAGAASRLFKAFVVDKQPNTVKSFSDNRYFSGGMYEQLGFTLEADIAPDYQVWSPKIGLRPKPHYQRRNIPKRLQEHGSVSEFDPATDVRTEREMTYLMGCGRIYDCGKKRWVWTG